MPRPIKHFRKGRVIPVEPITANNLTGKDPHNNTISVNINEAGLINYNMNRFVASSKGSSLGGGAGGRGLLNEMLDNPGSFIIKQNTLDISGNFNDLQQDCKTCEGVGIISSYYPNNTYLTDNPEPNTTNPVLCCNEEYFKDVLDLAKQIEISQDIKHICSIKILLIVNIKGFIEK